MPTTGPFFAVDGGDVMMFYTREEAERYLEVADVRDSVYELFTSDGTSLRMTVAKSRVVVTDEALGEEPQHLADVLRRFLLSVPERRRAMDDAAVSQADLRTLAAEFTRIERGS